MGRYMKMCVLTTIFLLLSLQSIFGARTLEGEEWSQKNLLFQSLQRGPVKQSQKNPCSTVPGRSRGRCTLGEMNVAGHVLPKFGAASIPEKGSRT
ncbi:hypothetical protein SESBI_41900 [Sesbania bispinosa]|nr:hypothetical protein SESBI_41900 [Sesbania bispinosa]